jgi:hypothetical protein
MALDDSLADGQADSGAGIGFARMKPLKNLEDTWKILGIDPDAVVPHPEHPAARLGSRSNPEFRGPLTTELDGVSDKVLEELNDLG